MIHRQPVKDLDPGPNFGSRGRGLIKEGKLGTHLSYPF
jgi:hypothetical protein